MVLVEILAQIKLPFAVVSVLQISLFTRKVTSGTCISTARDTATKRTQNSLFGRRAVLCIQTYKELFRPC